MSKQAKRNNTEEERIKALIDVVEYVPMELPKSHESHLKFEKRGPFDPFHSVKDVALEKIGKNGGIHIKQNYRHYAYTSWNDVYKDQSQEWKWNIWLDPSAPAGIIHPPKATEIEGGSKVVSGKCPTKVDLAKEFGTNVDFIYMTPPWDTNLHGNGKRGYFTLKHLKKLDLSKVQKQGFVFMYIQYELLPEIIEIMEEKDYGYADSTSAVLSDWSRKLLLDQRVKNPKSP
eukprot:UN29239